MAYPRRTSDPRRTSGSYHPRASSSEEDSPSLAPPRPFFLGGSAERGSWSSSQDTSLDPASDSDREQPPPSIPARVPPRSTTVPVPRTSPGRTHRTHHRRPSSMANPPASPIAAAVATNGYAQVDAPAPESTASHSDAAHTWTPDALYQDAPIPSPTTPGQSVLLHSPSRPPPSSFAFPFQAYPGNPDPGMAIPGLSRRRSSLESVPQAGYHPLSPSGSLTDLRRPYPPFMQGGESGSITPPSSSSNSLYKNSAAANMMSSSPSAIALNDMGQGNTANLPRSSSTQTFRAPFLAPSSRPSSSIWAPPSYNQQLVNGSGADSPSASVAALGLSAALGKKAPLPSTRLPAPLDKSEKPWLSQPEPRARLSWWLTLFCIFLGIAAAGIICWTGISGVHKLDESKMCSILNENFDGGDLDDSTWTKEVQLGGFGNGEFQMATDDPENIFIQNSQLYIYPTLSSDTIQNVLDGGNYTIPNCSTQQTNATACSASSSSSAGTVINPVRSARINTKGKKSIRYGKVEVKAKIPRGDWLWPAIWMLPEDETYGAWPRSGEIDIMEARGNGPEYTEQGSNFVRSSLNYGPMSSLIKTIFGWQSMKRTSFDQDFHVYGMEWDEKFMRFYVDSRIHAMLDLTLTGKKDGFWERAGFPQTAQNGSAQVVVQDPYSSKSAPFDQSFYLIVDLAAGGTSGWFPDNKGNKPWYDGSLTAMRDFALAQSTWSATWPSNKDDRAFRIDSVKMWSSC